MLIEHAIGLVGLTIALHASPLPLPKSKPFGCGYCTSFWLGVAWFLAGPDSWSDAMIGVGLTSAMAAVVLAQAPWLFRQMEDENNEKY